MSASKLVRCSGALICMVMLFNALSMTAAFSADLDRKLAFNIPSQPLGDALSEFSRQAQFQVTASAGDLTSQVSDALLGNYSIEDALTILLRHSGLAFKQVAPSAIAIGHFSMPPKGMLRSPATDGGVGAAARSRDSGQQNGTAAGRSAHATGTGNEDRRDEIIVSAQKRSERLQDVPVSETVITSDQLSQLQIDSGAEIARRTPNLHVSLLGDESQPKFSIRGISTPEFNLNAVSPTGVFYDEVYVASSFLGGPQLFDLDRVEVLRGPQGTLFGKNTTGGAINFISRLPTYETHAALTAQFGDFGYYHLDGMAEAPIIADTVAIRAAFDVARSSAFIRNVDPRGHDLSNIDRRAGRVSMAYKNLYGFDALLRVFATDSSPEAIGAINQGIFAGGVNARGVNPRLNPYNGRPLTSSEGAYDRSGMIRTHGIGTNLILTEEFGSFVLTSITSLLKGHFTNLVDADGSYLDLLHLDFYADTREISQDLRIATGGAGPFKLIAGIYFFQDRVAVDTTYHLFDEATVLRQQYTQHRRSHAGYVDGTYDIFPALTAYAGIRHTDDEGDIHDFRVMPTIPGPLSARYHDTAPTGRAGIRLKVGSDSMAYAQYARGYRSSAINGGALTAAADFNVAKPEKIDTYEVGAKAQWFERRLTTNASAFRYDFSNQQFVNVAGIDNQQLVNAGRSRITGAELESAGRITEALQFSVGLGLLHSVYETLTLDGMNLAGHELIEAPHHTVTLGLDYTMNLASGGALVLHGDGVDVGAQFYSAYNNIPPYNLLKTPSFWDANVRVAWHDVSGRYEIALWGKNVFGNQVATGMQIDPTTGTLFTTVPYRARYGAEVGIRF